MNIDHSFTSKVKHRACSKSIAHHEIFHNFGSMYKVCLYYDEGSPEVSAGPPEVPGPPDVSGPPVVLPMLLLPKKGKFIKCFSPNIVLHRISSLCLNEKYLVKHKINNPNASIIDTQYPM